MRNSTIGSSAHTLSLLFFRFFLLPIISSTFFLRNDFLTLAQSKTTVVKSDDVIALVSVVGEGLIDPEEELQLGVTKALAGEPIQLKKKRVFAQIGERGELTCRATLSLTRTPFGSETT